MKLRGAIPSPKCRAFATIPHKAAPVPDTWGVVPTKLTLWGNSTYGDCVSAEEAAAKAQYSTMCGLSETYISDAEVISWARSHGFLNGANLTDVMDAMAKSGMTANGQTYGDGAYQSVDWTNDAVLSSAIYQGPVKIGVAADQLSNAGAGDHNGWWGTGFKHDNNEDHCVNLCGFGTAQQLADLMKVPVKSGVSPTARCYLLFTWGTIGIIDQPSMLAITGEAWLRLPTTPGQLPVPPTPIPVPPPVPVPPIPPPGPPPSPDVLSGSYQIGVYLVTWTAVIFDPPPIAGA